MCLFPNIFMYRFVDHRYTRAGYVATVEPLGTVVHKTKNLVHAVTESLGNKELLDSKKVSFLKAQTKVLATYIGNFLKDLEKVHQDNVDEAFQEVQTIMSETSAKLLEAVGPENRAEAEELLMNLNDALKIIVAVIDKWTEDAKPEAKQLKPDVQSATRNFLREIDTFIKNFENKIKKYCRK